MKVNKSLSCAAEMMGYSLSFALSNNPAPLGKNVYQDDNPESSSDTNLQCLHQPLSQLSQDCVI